MSVTVAVWPMVGHAQTIRPTQFTEGTLQVVDCDVHATPRSPEEFASYIAAQHKIWVDVGKAAGVKID